MNWEKILWAYIEHVGKAEGTDFIRPHTRLPELTEEENAALREIADRKECPK